MNKEISFKKILYSKLNARQQENYNYQKASAILADYGFNTLRLSDDWQGADFIAIHISGKDFLKVQLKGGLSFYKKYIGKDIWVCFPYQANWFLYPHDILLEIFGEKMNFTKTKAWKDGGGFRWPRPTKSQILVLSKYIL